MDMNTLISAGRESLKRGDLCRASDQVWFIKLINKFKVIADDLKRAKPRSINEIIGFYFLGNAIQIEDENKGLYDLYIEYLKKLPYSEYLKTQHWKSIRKYKYKAADYHCQKCRCVNKKLHVHHLTYESRGNESMNDLIVLCADCHKKEHTKPK